MGQDAKTIRSSVLSAIGGALVTFAIGAIYFILTAPFTFLTSNQAEAAYVKRDVLEVVLLRIDGRLSRIEKQLAIEE